MKKIILIGLFFLTVSFDQDEFVQKQPAFDAGEFFKFRISVKFVIFYVKTGFTHFLGFRFHTVNAYYSIPPPKPNPQNPIQANRSHFSQTLPQP